MNSIAEHLATTDTEFSAPGFLVFIMVLVHICSADNRETPNKQFGSFWRREFWPWWEFGVFILKV